MRYFLLDKVTHVETGKSAWGIKCISFSDEVLHDHFPDFPIMPGALIVEGLAQLAGFLLEVTFNGDETVEIRRAVLAQIDKMKFYGTCGPGDQLEMKATLLSQLEDAAQVQVEASVKGERRVRGTLIFSMLKIASENVTAQRRGVYKIWTRELTHPPTLR